MQTNLWKAADDLAAENLEQKKLNILINGRNPSSTQNPMRLRQTMSMFTGCFFAEMSRLCRPETKKTADFCLC